MSVDDVDFGVGDDEGRMKTMKLTVVVLMMTMEMTKVTAVNSVMKRKIILVVANNISDEKW